MAKKGGKKKKGKKKKKEKDLKPGLSNRERETYLLTIEELEHKIKWRNHMIAIIQEDLKFFNEKLQLQKSDKNEAIKLLEDAIDEQRGLTEKIQRAIPDAESAKSQGEERRARELAAKLMKMNQERLSNDAELDVLRKKLFSLEAYNPSKVDEKIKEIEKQLESEDVEDVFLKAEEQDIRRKKIFTKEMQDILRKEADSFQIEISGKLDKNFERITEETRWWADTVNGLNITAERLEDINEVKSTNLRSAQRELKIRKEISLRESTKLQEQKEAIKDVMQSIKELESEMREQSERLERINFLDSIADNLKQSLDNQENYFTSSFNQLETNEIELKNLEEQLSNEISFGDQLRNYIEKAQQLIMEEVKYPLILTYDGPPPEKNTIEEMRCLFEEAARFIYDRQDKSMI